MLGTVLATVGISTLGNLPVFLLSAQAVLIREDLRLTEPQLGFAVSAFYAAAAAGSFAAARLIERLGQRWNTVLGGMLAVVGTLGISVFAVSYWALLLLLVVAGLANAALQMTANAVLATSVRVENQGLAFGVKQSASPLAGLLGGLAVPTFGVLFGWTAAFGLVACAAGIVAIAGLCQPTRPARARNDRPVEKAPTRAVLASTVAMTLAALAATSLGAFLAPWAFEVGLDAGDAGLLLAGASGLCILGRIAAGVAADRRGGRNLPRVAAHLVVGAVALVLISFATLPSLVIGGVIAFAVGWSWPGLLLFAVVRVARDSAESSLGALQAGAFVGGAGGPVLFGLLVAGTSYATAWRLAGLTFIFAAGFVLLARRLFAADVRRRPLRLGDAAGLIASPHRTDRRKPGPAADRRRS